MHVADLGVHEAAEQIRWLDSNDWVIGAGTLLLAGVYQFTPLKYHCPHTHKLTQASAIKPNSRTSKILSLRTVCHIIMPK